MTAALKLTDLRTVFDAHDGPLPAVDGVSLEIAPGEIHGLVGESGSGKSITAFSVMGLLEPPGRIAGGRIELGGADITGLSGEAMRSLRGRRIAMVFQDPMMTLNPLMTVGAQMVDAVLAHERVSRKAALDRAEAVLRRMGIPSPRERLAAWPGQFSGGMRQRVSIAIALLNGPDIILADEPTTALDVTIQSQILHEVRDLARESGTAFLWITHDLSVVSGLADSLSVMYMGRIVEQGGTGDILEDPAHPYTRGLIASLPTANTRGKPLNQIPGAAPALADIPAGCAFAPRCARAGDQCRSMVPELEAMTAGRVVRCFHPHEKEPLP